MRFYHWSPELSVKIDAIDQQHNYLFEIINDLATAISENKSKNTLRTILAKLLKHEEEHFRMEEALFEKYNYPDANDHIAEHHNFILKTKALQAIYEDGRYDITFDTLHFLRDWITTHIKTADMAYAAYIILKDSQSA